MFLAASVLRKYFLSTAYSESQKNSDEQRGIRQQRSKHYLSCRRNTYRGQEVRIENAVEAQ